MLRRDDIGRHLTSEVVFSGDRWPGFSDTIDHPDGLVLVDTGMIDTTPELDEEWQPTPHPLQVQYPEATYVGSDKCKSCHQHAYQVWERKGPEGKAHSIA